MANSKKVVAALSTAAITGLITTALGSTAFAKTSAVLVNNGSNNYKYDLSALNGSYADYSNDSKQGALYQDYATKIASGKVAAVYDDAQKAYIDFAKLSSDFADAIANGKTFDLNAYTEASKNIVTEDPATILDASVGSDGKVTYINEQTPATNLAVSSVSATNYKEIVVTFNKAVDKTTAQNINNYVLTGDTLATSLSGATPVVQADGKTVVITLPGATVLKNQSSDALKVSGVKDTTGNVITATTTNFTPLDTTLPTVTGNVQVVGPNTLRVTFNEPIMTLPTITVDNNTYSASVAATAGDTHSVDVTLGSVLPAGNHMLAVSGAVDYANFSNVSTNLAFSYAQDTSALTASVVSAAQNQVVFKFNKAVPASLQGYVSVYHTYNNVDQYKATSLSWASDNQTVTATFAGNYLPIGNDTVYVNAGTSPNVVKDAWGNAFASASYNVAITADTTAPTVTAVSYVDANHIDVAYSKTVTGATTVTNYTLKDSNGNAVSVLSAIQDATNPQLYHLTTATLAGGSYSLSIAGIKDLSLAQNALTPYATTVAVPDTTAPTVGTHGVSYTTDKTKLIVSFSKQIATTGAYSALDATKYEINDPTFGDKLVSQISGATVTLGADGKSVVITLPSALTSTSPVVNIGQVADLAGNISAVIGAKTAEPNDVTISNIDLTNVKATSKTTVTFDVNTTLSKIDVSKFKLNSLPAVSATSATYVNGVGKSTVTLTFGSNVLKSDLSNLATSSPVADLTDFTIDAKGLTNSLGTSNSATITILGTSVQDLIAPSVATAQTVDNNNNGELDAIKLTFDEALYTPSVSDSDFTVDGHSITSVSVSIDGKTVTLNLKEAGLDATTTPKVTITGAVEDVARNSIVAGSTVTPTATVSAASTKTAEIGAILTGSTVSAGLTPGSYTVAVPTTLKDTTTAALVQSFVTADTAKKLTSNVVVTGAVGTGDLTLTPADVTSVLANGVVDTAKLNTLLTSKGVTATTLSALDGHTITVNGVNYTINIK